MDPRFASALAELSIAERRAVLSEKFADECPTIEFAVDHYDGARPERFDAALSREFDLLEAQIERAVSPPAHIVQIIPVAVPMRLCHAIYDHESGRHLCFDHQTPVLALALRADGTISAMTEHDVCADGALTKYHPYPDVETGRAYYLDESTGEASPTIYDTAATEMAAIETLHREVRRCVAQLAPVKKEQAAK